MEELLRTQVSRFRLENAYTLSQIEESKEKGKLEELILPIDEMFSEYPKAVVMDRWKKLIYNGNPFPDRAVLDKLDVRDEEPVRVYDQEEHFIGLYRYRAAKKDAFNNFRDKLLCLHVAELIRKRTVNQIINIFQTFFTFFLCH